MSSAALTEPRIAIPPQGQELGSALLGERLIVLAKLAAAAHMAQVLRDTSRDTKLTHPRSA